MEKLLPCLICGSEFDPAFGPAIVASTVTEPSEGTTFISHGNYGSTVFDPTPTSVLSLRVNICDQCLLKHKDRILIVRAIPVAPIVQYKFWDPTIEDLN